MSRKKYTITEIQKIAQSHDGKLLSTKYINKEGLLWWECKNKHIWPTKLNTVNNGSWCPHCYKNNKHIIHKHKSEKILKTIRELNEISKERGGECLGKDINSKDSKYIFKCKDGHTWSTRKGVVKMGSWCPECVSSLGEEICRCYFEQIFKKPFTKIRPLWLKNNQNNNIELDGYCTELSIAFEHNGRQHYDNSNIFYNYKIEDFNKIIEHDKIKIKYCSNNNIKLFIIPELINMLKISELKNEIKTQANILNVILPHDFDEIKIDLLQAYNSKKEKISQSFSFKDSIVTGLSDDGYAIFKCDLEHEFKGTGQNNRSVWCPECTKLFGKNFAIDDYFKQNGKRGLLLINNYKKNRKNKRFHFKDSILKEINENNLAVFVCDINHEFTACRKDEGKSFCPDCTNIFGKRFSGTKIFKQLGKVGLLQQLKEKEQSVKGSSKS